MAASHLRAALSRILRSPSRQPASSHTPPLVFLHRLLHSSDAAVPSSGSFAAEDYLVSRCGLTQAQALKAAAKLSHIRSRARPDAVLAYLEGTLGIPAADVVRVLVMDPSFLCVDVEQTLAQRVDDLRDLGLSRDEIARLLPLSPNSFRNRSLRSNLEFWLAELGSLDKVLQVVRTCSALLNLDLDKVAKPNVAFLRQIGLNISEIVGRNLFINRLCTINPQRLKEYVQRVEGFGVEHGTWMFLRMLCVVAVTSKDVLATRIRLLHELGFSKDDLLVILRKQPLVLGLSEQKILGNMGFLMKAVGLEVSYIVRRPALLMYSVERRLLPRYCLLKVLREKGLLKVELDYYVTASMGEKIFLKKFVHPFTRHVPGLGDNYASKFWGRQQMELCSQKAEMDAAEACRGKDN